MNETIIYGSVIGVVVLVLLIMALLNRYRRCPSDKILVVYGTTGDRGSAKCVHGGGTFVWPVIQDYAYLSLTPIGIDAHLTNALSRQNIRVDVPCRGYQHRTRIHAGCRRAPVGSSVLSDSGNGP